MNLCNRNFSDVSIHFNQKDHNLESHFKFLYYQSKLNEKDRKNKESDLINISYSLMNTHILSLFLLNSLSFA